MGQEISFCAINNATINLTTGIYQNKTCLARLTGDGFRSLSCNADTHHKY